MVGAVGIAVVNPVDPLRCPAVSLALFMSLGMRAECNLIAADDLSTGLQVQLMLAFLNYDPVSCGGGFLRLLLWLRRLLPTITAAEQQEGSAEQ